MSSVLRFVWNEWYFSLAFFLAWRLLEDLKTERKKFWCCPLESVDEYKNVVSPKLNFQKGNSQYEILNHVYFGPNFTFGDFFFCRRPTMVVKSFTQRSFPLTIKKLPTALLMHSHWTKFATLNALTCYYASFWSHLCIFLTHVSYFLIWNLSKNIFKAVH